MARKPPTNVISPEDIYHNPLNRLPARDDEFALSVGQTWWVRSDGEGSYVEVDP